MANANAKTRTKGSRSTSSKRTAVKGEVHSPRKGTQTERILKTYDKVSKTSDNPIADTADKVGTRYQTVWGTLARYEVI